MGPYDHGKRFKDVNRLNLFDNEIRTKMKENAYGTRVYPILTPLSGQTWTIYKTEMKFWAVLAAEKKKSQLP